MLKRNLGSLQVPAVGMGTASSSGFDVDSSEALESCRRIVDACLTHGSTIIDTSPMYRRAEGVLGEVLQGRRDEFQLATKVWCAGLETGRAQMARSFALLKTDHIEVMQIHNLVDWRTHLPELEKMQAQGKIDLIGLSHHQKPFFPELAEIMRTGRVDCIQVPYNVLERDVEEEILPLAQDMGIGVIVMRPVGRGVLVRGLKTQPDLSPLKEYGIETWGQAALAWLLSDSRISLVIPATSRHQRISENAAAGSVIIPAELREYISSEAKRCL